MSPTIIVHSAAAPTVWIAEATNYGSGQAWSKPFPTLEAATAWAATQVATSVRINGV